MVQIVQRGVEAALTESRALGKGVNTRGGRLVNEAVAKALGMEEGAVRVAIHRLRKRYRALLRDEIAQTLADGSPVEEELRALFGAFA